MELDALQRHAPEFGRLGARIVALTPMLAERCRDFAAARGLTFDLLSDPGNLVAQRFGVALELPTEQRSALQGLGLDLVSFNGDESWTLPITSRFLIDVEGIVRHASVDADHTKRPDPDELLQALRDLVPAV